MRLLGRQVRQPSLPAELREPLELGAGDQVLAWSRLAVSGAVAATRGEVHVLTPRGSAIVEPWTQVRSAAWDAESGTLALQWVGRRPMIGLELLDPGRLPQVIYERVQHSLVLSVETPLPDDSRNAIWTALRRAADGTLITQSMVPAGISVDDPAVAAVIAGVQAALREEAGVIDLSSGPGLGVGDPLGRADRPL